MFILHVKQHGNGPEKAAVLSFDFIPSVSSFLDMVLHPKVRSISLLIFHLTSLHIPTP